MPEKMNIFDRANHWWDGVEYSFVTMLSKIIPLAVPLIPAYVGYSNVTGILGYHQFFGITYGAVVEGFGYAAIFKAVQFWENNRHYTKAENKAPLWIAVLIYIMYLSVTLAVNVMLSLEAGVEAYKVVAIAFISLLSVPAGLLMSVSAVHTERTIQRENEKEWRRERANEQRTNSERTNAGRRTANLAVRSARTQDVRYRIAEYVERTRAEQGRTPGPSEVAEALGVSKGYASDTLRSLPVPEETYRGNGNN